MTQIQKLIAKIRNSPKQVRFEDLDKVLRRHGFEGRVHGTADVVYVKGDKLVVVPKPHGGVKHVKPVYVRKALVVLEGEPLDGEGESDDQEG